MSFYWDWAQAFTYATEVIQQPQVATIIDWISFVICAFLILQQITSLVIKPPQE